MFNDPLFGIDLTKKIDSAYSSDKIIVDKTVNIGKQTANILSNVNKSRDISRNMEVHDDLPSRRSVAVDDRIDIQINRDDKEGTFNYE